MSEWDEDYKPYNGDRDKTIVWARGLLARQDWVIFDTETSGLGAAEILQIGLLAPSGETLMDTKVKPSWVGFASGGGIEARALAVHGITEESCAGCPAITDLLPEMREKVSGKTIIVYNAEFDHGVLCGCLERRDVPIYQDAWPLPAKWECAMKQYSAFVGDWNNYYGNYKFQRLPGGDHTAIGDCRATLKMIERMAAAKLSTEQQED